MRAEADAAAGLASGCGNAPPSAERMLVSRGRDPGAGWRAATGGRAAVGRRGCDGEGWVQARAAARRRNGLAKNHRKRMVRPWGW